MSLITQNISLLKFLFISLPVSQENSEDEAFVDVVKPDELPEPDLEPEDLSLEPEIKLLSLFPLRPILSPLDPF